MTEKSKIQNPKSKINPKSQIPILKLEIGICFVVLVLFVVLGFALDAHAEPVSSTELINNAKQYDGKTVVYEGEVIGDVMLRQDFAWLNVNDAENAIGIWLSSSLAKGITYTGSYKSKGDWIEVSGVFHRACPEHGGDLDIHAQVLRRKIPGRNIQEKLNPAKINLAATWLGILGFVWILTLLKRR